MSQHEWISLWGRWLLTTTFSSKVNPSIENESNFVRFQFKCIERPDNVHLKQDQDTLHRLVKKLAPKANLLDVPHPVIIEYDMEFSDGVDGVDGIDVIFDLQRIFTEIPRHVQ